MGAGRALGAGVSRGHATPRAHSWCHASCRPHVQRWPCCWVGLVRRAVQSLQLFYPSVENGQNCFMCERPDCPKAQAERRIQARVRRSGIPWHQLMRNDAAVCILVTGWGGSEALGINPVGSCIGFVEIAKMSLHNVIRSLCTWKILCRHE